MPHKVDHIRRCADLLAALARTANVRLALKETGVSAYWAYRRRKADPDFDARWKTAVRAGKRELAKAAAALARDPHAPRPGAGAGLTIVGSSGKGTLRLERVKPTTFTVERRAAFLDVLRATCNVKAAARAVGISPTGAYRHYHADASLRAAWEAALAEGRVHLEMALIGAARALFEVPDQQAHPVGFDTSDPKVHPASVEGASEQRRPVAAPECITGMDAKVALQLLRLHSPRDAAGRVRGRWVKPADADETRREILAKVAAVRAAGERDAGPSSTPCAVQPEASCPREGGDPGSRQRSLRETGLPPSRENGFPLKGANGNAR